MGRLRRKFLKKIFRKQECSNLATAPFTKLTERLLVVILFILCVILREGGGGGGVVDKLNLLSGWEIIFSPPFVGQFVGL